MYELVTQVPGYTGLGITLPLVIIVSSATEVIRYITRTCMQMYTYSTCTYVYVCTTYMYM